eukprot:TRINITY_DN2752_c0_g1_i1.p1 TRINITY_DN2752_c0_g1~~TRINITY_DN2752_c0_g1_i1.p1  ORF type:complete len:1475 (-),score=331.47 TRINITY_DN2752_c0_g1_i1:100-4146(-)
MKQFRKIIHLIENGQLTEAMEMKERVIKKAPSKSLSTEAGDEEEEGSEPTAQKKEIEEESDEEEEEESDEDIRADNSAPSDAVLDSKQMFLDNIRKYRVKFCPHCSKKSGTVKSNRANDRLFVKGLAAKIGKTAASGAPMKLLTVQEVKEHLESVWKNDGDILNRLWGTRELDGRRVNSPDMFFMEVIVVTPNRFRPLAFTGTVNAEDSKTQLYKNILLINLDISTALKDKVPKAKMLDLWIKLQSQVNMLVFGDTKLMTTRKTQGLKQILERKEGLFRSKMMGKRVNHSARTVISSDAYIETNEIGVPLVFAKKLTFPESVTHFNVEELRQAVINGPNVHPGAVYVETNNGRKTKLSETDQTSRIAQSKLLLSAELGEVKKVYRHMKTGDVVLMNRQPSLHKPSIMAHKVRVLARERTLRLHYANCKTYNADFDGDEMNLHFPQDHLSRAECHEIALTDNQYTVPTSGDPIRGLIQDHIVTGVLLTKKDSFFTKDTYQQLVYLACSDLLPTPTVHFCPPCLIKPKRLWSGKQIISTILDNFTRGRKPMNLEQSKTKIPVNLWNTFQEEGYVNIHNNELLTGVLEKSQLGSSNYGLIHASYELYGPTTAGKLLTAFSRLLTGFLQYSAFTCSIEDMILTAAGEGERKRLLRVSDQEGKKVSVKFAGLAEDSDTSSAGGIENVRASVEEMFSNINDRELLTSSLDLLAKNQAHDVTSKILKACIPNAQRRLFPENNMSLMTLSGAKGGLVNFSQISCLLGQQELEGKRPPRMYTGRTLPCFEPYDINSRAGGFINDRFLTGLRPQEYFFHCMAGREGLLDTAVKTAKSGYLQRCLIKHLEGVRVHYDMTVRNSDKSVIQFQYGEDGIDPVKSKYLSQFGFLLNNVQVLHEKNISSLETTPHLLNSLKSKEVTDYAKALSKNPSLDPLLSNFNPGAYLGVVSEKFNKDFNAFVEKNKDLLKKGTKTSKDNFETLMQLKYMRSLIEPGEAVGLLASQSVGEPSTQMTLNTFHLAGFGGANMTLGIPRVREIIMHASTKIGNMFLPLIPGLDEKANSLVKRFDQVPLSSTLKDILLTMNLKSSDGSFVRVGKLKFIIHDNDILSSQYAINAKNVKDCLHNEFVPGLAKAFSNAVKNRKKDRLLGLSVDKVDDQSDDEGMATSDVEMEEASDSRKSNLDEEAAKSPRAKKRASYDDDEDEPTMNTDDEDRDKDSFSATDTETDASESEEFNPESFINKKFSGGKYSYKLSLTIPPHLNIHLMNLVENIVKKLVVKCVPGIKKCFITEDVKTKETIVQTEGVNIPKMWEFGDVIDVNRIYTNDINQMLKHYGVEAAFNSIKKEIDRVFGDYAKY